MTEATPPRRGSHVQMPVAYAAVGASKLPDVTRFPPAGTTPFEESLRLGSGQPRFLTSSSLLMTWAAQRGAGVDIEEVANSDDPGYVGPEFTKDGTPVLPGAPEEQFAPDGTPYIKAGARVRMTRADGVTRELLVIYTIDEPARAGFAWGTVDDLGAVGEQLFVVEHRDDDSVWAVGRGFLSSPRTGFLGRKGRQEIATAIEAVPGQLRALFPGASTEAE